MFASLELPVPAPPKTPVVGVEAPAGLAPNKLGVPADAGAAGFEAAPPNKPPSCVLPPAWGVCPNRLGPGGGPAGVVEGRKDVLFVAGVAVGFEPVMHR